MGRKSSIDQATGAQLIAAYAATGSKRAAAEQAGVSIGSAMRYFDSLPAAAAPALATPATAAAAQLVEQAGASLWSTRDALDENYNRLIRLVEVAQAAGSSREIMAYTGVLREIRAHIETGMDLLRLLVDVDEIRAFQTAVLEAIGDADEPTRQRIIEKLRQRRSIALSLV